VYGTAALWEAPFCEADLMSELWQEAPAASSRFAAQAQQYDHFRPRYPTELFDRLLVEAHLAGGDAVVEIGAGTGLATLPLVERGLKVHAVEPAEELADLVRFKVGDRGVLVPGRFEDCPLPERVRLVTSFNAWHWVEPGAGVERAARLLGSGDSLALVWTEVVSWGEPPFEERLAAIFGSSWPKEMPHVGSSMSPVRSDPRFGNFEVFHHPFARQLNGRSYVGVTQTYGGLRTREEYAALEQVIVNEFEGSVTKVEDAVLYLSKRL
jgi:SAM-dependent methyltransferase